MKKSLQERLNASLDKALDPPRKRPKQDLDALLEEYDDGQAITPRANHVSAGALSVPTPIPQKRRPENAPPAKEQSRAPVMQQQAAEDELGDEIFVFVDATHTASEKIIYSHMYRETVSKGRPEGHFGPSLLMKLSGIRSRNTIHKALYGLIEKLSVEKVAEAVGSPFGPRYRVHGPQEILRRRKSAGMVIDPQTKKITTTIPATIPTAIPTTIPESVPTTIPEGIPARYPNYPKIWDRGIPNFGILLNRVNIRDDVHFAEGSSSEPGENDDDEAFAGFVKLMRQTAEEVTGRAPSAAERKRWTDLAELLSAELKLAAGRTTVSSAPAFLTEHLRRRLWKKDGRQIEAEEAEATQRKTTAATRAEITRCPDCFGTGMYYPDGYDRGVAKCRHERARSTPEEADDFGPEE